MEKDNLKNVWKSEVNTSIDTYSDEELKKIAINAIRKALKPIYPKWVLGISILVVLFLIWKIITWNNSLQIVVLDAIALTILIASSLILLYSKRKMNADNKNMTTKEWVKFRLDAMEQSYRRKAKYGIFIYITAFTVGLGILWHYFYFLTLFNTLVWIGSAIFLLLFIVVLRKEEIKRYEKVISNLKELYKQFEE